MAQITNNHSTALGLPGELIIPAGESREVKNWDSMQHHDVVKAWLDAGVLSVNEAPAAADGDNGKGDDKKPVTGDDSKSVGAAKPAAKA